MGALYEDVEKFFGDIFAYYGRFLARYPIVFILISLLTSCLLGLGLLNLEYETSVEKLYTPMGSPAVKDQEKLASLFPDSTADNFFSHQQIFLDTYGDIIITGLEEKQNILTDEVIYELKQLYESIMDITLEQNDRGHKYTDLCASRDGRCVVDGSVLLDVLESDHCIDSNTSYPVIRDRYRKEDLREVLAGISADNGCLTAEAMRIRFNLRHDTDHQRQLGLLWELKFLERLGEAEPVNMQLYYSSSESLDLELNEHTGKDTKFFALTIIIMMIYSTFVSAGGNWVSTRVLLAQAGLLAALLAILASFGLLSMCGMKFVDICGVMPFLVLGVGVDDMFILMSGWRQTDLKAPIEDRISETFRSSAISVTITSLTDLLAFCIGATSPFLSVKNFCIYTGVAIFWCYINQLTFFGGCLVLHARRIESSLHCITCMKTKSRSELQEEGHSRLWILFCSGHPSKKAGEDDSPCEKIPSSVLPKVLLQGPTKMLVIVGFIVYFGIAIWGGSKIKTGLKLESVVPESSYVADYYEMKQNYFSNQGAVVMFVIDKPVDYHHFNVHFNVQDAMRIVFYKAKKTGYLDERVEISWLEDYTKYRKNNSLGAPTADDFVPVLLNDFLPKHPQYIHDIVLSEDKTRIEASRYYVTSKRFEDSTHEGNMMIAMRHIAGNSSLPMLAYSPYFIYYEHYVSILKNTLLAVGVAVIGMLFVALMFIPHPISVTCVTITMVTIVLGMFGFMHFWGLALSAITTVQIILSVGFCVDFTVHISHAFMTATGKNRNERVMAALEKVGVPILNGAFSSILGILMLAFAGSYIFKSFFKTMLLVIVLGLAHSLLLLPVVLSFIGPRRTSKPRMFIPISSQGTRDKLQTEQSMRGRLERQASVKTTEEPNDLAVIHQGAEDVELMKLPSFAEEEEENLLDIPDGPGFSQRPAEPTSLAASIYSGSRQASEDLGGSGLDLHSVVSSKSKDVMSRGRSLDSEASVEKSPEEKDPVTSLKDKDEEKDPEKDIKS